MTGTRTYRPVWLVLPALALAAGPLPAADRPSKEPVKTEPVALPRPSEIRAIEAYPSFISLKGGDDARQLIVTAALQNGRLQDLSGDATYEVADAKVVRVTSSGRVIPLADGATEIVARYGDKQVAVPVKAEAVAENLPINFANQVVPVFTKLGCNTGACHGKASGQNGFKLSLLGFEPEVDYAALVEEGRGRRLFPAAPERSLLLLKTTGVIAHGGGKRMEVGSDEYKLVRRWIGAGTPVGNPDDPVVTKITIYPEHRILSRHNKQQFAVYAHYSDGSVEDITRRAQYESNDAEIALAEPSGLVRT